MARLEQIDQDLALRQNELEAAAMEFFKAKRDKEQEWAHAYLSSKARTIPERKAEADLATADVGRDEEAAYEALRAVVRVLETRASIGQSILRAQGRVGA
jgi:hypothetical protein